METYSQFVLIHFLLERSRDVIELKCYFSNTFPKNEHTNVTSNTFINFSR